MIPKPKRVRNKKLLESFRLLRCIVCAKLGCDPCHIKSRGAGGGDEVDNLMPLCREHHRMQHQKGIVTFVKSFPQVMRYLRAKGWVVEQDKLRRDA